MEHAEQVSEKMPWLEVPEIWAKFIKASGYNGKEEEHVRYIYQNTRSMKQNWLWFRLGYEAIKKEICGRI